MPQTEARKTLKDAPIMWRRINSIGMILDCNSTYASNLGYVKSEILGKPIFEHVPKESWESMNDSLKMWFETGKVTDRKITFVRQDKTTFSGLLQATSLYDENKNITTKRMSDSYGFFSYNYSYNDRGDVVSKKYCRDENATNNKNHFKLKKQYAIVNETYSYVRKDSTMQKNVHNNHG